MIPFQIDDSACFADRIGKAGIERKSFAIVRWAAVGRNLKYSEISVRVTDACNHQRVGGKLLGITGWGTSRAAGSASDSSARLRGMW